MSLILVFLGTSGCGKTTLMRALAERFPHHVRLVRSVTTRARRGTEEDDLFYDFLSEDAFEHSVACGEIVLACRGIHGHSYGVLKQTLEELGTFVGVLAVASTHVDTYRAYFNDLWLFQIVATGASGREGRVEHAVSRETLLSVAPTTVIENDFLDSDGLASAQEHVFETFKRFFPLITL